MKTVVHFIDSRAFGGTERVVLQLLAGLDRRRWRPVLFHHPEPGLAPVVDRARQLQVEIRSVPRMNTIHDLAQLSQFVRAVRAERPEIVHAHLTWPLSCKYGLLAAALARTPAVVATAHLCTDLSTTLTLRMQPRFIALAVDRYLAVSEGVARQLREDFRIPAAKVQVVRNGIDLAPFQRPRSAALRDTLTRGFKRPVVLTAARLVKQKGHCHLIDAAVQVPDALFVFAGDGPEREVLETQAHTRGMSERILFLGQRDDIPELLASADLFVLPSLYEGLPLSVMEAMAAGTPVIATAIGGTDELVTPNRTGLLVPPSDPFALAAAIQTLLAAPTLARQLADAAQRQAHRTFAVEQMVQRVVQAYEELLSR